MMMLFSKQIRLTILSVLLKFFSIALFNYRHFSVRIPKILLPQLLACDSLQLKLVLHMTYPFMRKPSLGTSLEDIHYPQGWRKTFLFHLPQNLQVLAG